MNQNIPKLFRAKLFNKKILVKNTDSKPFLALPFFGKEAKVNFTVN
jgi:hypothetical protein